MLDLFSRIVDLCGYTDLAEYIGLLGAILAYVGAVVYLLSFIKITQYEYKMGCEVSAICREMGFYTK